MEQARQFVEWDPNVETRAQVATMISEGDVAALTKIMSGRLAFGTAGLRGPMGPGFNRMNDLVILQTCQGLAVYLEATQGPEAKAMGVVVGYDHRQLGSLSSEGFALITAAVFADRGFKVYLLDKKTAAGEGGSDVFVPTPFVAFGVNHFKCCAGIMVTASHNPKADNGYKVYWSNGSQIISPHDTGIATAIQANLSPSHPYELAPVSIRSNPLVSNVTDEIASAYFASLQRLSLQNFERNELNPVRIAYTAMHGVGEYWIKRAMELFRHKDLHLVKEQCLPDANFTTVAFPNPEEKGALNLAQAFADANNCTVIVANDPDADRLALAEKQASSGWKVFTGNEIGILLGHWMITQWRDKGIGGVPAHLLVAGVKPAVMATVVSSRMLRSMALAEGCSYFDTLTGFKWLGNKCSELRSQGVPVLFFYEEALGYCVGDLVADKDGVSAAAVCVEMIASLAEEGKTIQSHLQSLYLKYGEFVSYNSYVFSYDNAVTDRIFHRIRHFPGASSSGDATSYWPSCAGVDITAVKDVTLGFDSSSADKKSDLPVTPESHMIMFDFANGCSVILRTSGTEPKIKFYTEMAGKPGQERAEVLSALHAFVNQVVEEMFQPAANGLTKP